jgi:hypothetical protein
MYIKYADKSIYIYNYTYTFHILCIDFMLPAYRPNKKGWAGLTSGINVHCCNKPFEIQWVIIYSVSSSLAFLLLFPNRLREFSHFLCNPFPFLLTVVLFIFLYPFNPLALSYLCLLSPKHAVTE